MGKRTKNDVDKAYALARRISRKFVLTHPRPVYHIDEEDYIQEAMVAWLEKRHIPYKLVDVYRQAAPVGRRCWLLNAGGTLTIHDPINIDLVAEYMSSGQNLEKDVDKIEKLKAVQKIVNNLVDPRKQIIIIMKYVNDMSLTDIAKGLGISRSYAGNLHADCINFIRKELEKDGYC